MPSHISFKHVFGASLKVQWLILTVSLQGMQVQYLAGERRTCMLHRAARNKQETAEELCACDSLILGLRVQPNEEAQQGSS